MDLILSLLIFACIVFIVIGFINPNKSLFFLNGEKTKLKSFVIYFSILIVLFISLGVVSKDDKAIVSGDLNETSTEEETKKAPETWTQVMSIKGNGTKKTKMFEITGSEAVIKYKYAGESGLGSFAVYVVEEGHSLEKEGGFPDLSIDKAEEGESAIQKGRGKYYLDINAFGDWEITIEEK